jgi:hypothetical protein
MFFFQIFKNFEIEIESKKKIEKENRSTAEPEYLACAHAAASAIRARTIVESVVGYKPLPCHL